jgi:hypothetical protein
MPTLTPVRHAQRWLTIAGNFALLPLRTRTRGPAVQLPALPADVTELTIDASHESYDPLDEILALFRANTFFRNFEIKGPADRVLIYGILYVSEVLGKIKPGMGRRDAEKVRCGWGLHTEMIYARLMHGTGCHEHRTRQQLRDPGRRRLPTEPGIRSAVRQERSRSDATIHHANATRAGDTVAEQGIRRGDQRSKQVVAKLHQEEVHGQGFVDRDRMRLPRD